VVVDLNGAEMISGSFLDGVVLELVAAGQLSDVTFATSGTSQS